MKIKRLITFSLVSLFAIYASAQTEVVEDDDSTKTEIMDLPEGLLISEEDLMNDYTNKTNLTPGTGTARELSADDSLIISRLSRIPTTIEMPLNNVTRKFIDMYTNKMKHSVAVMLGAGNFYNPIFEEALERYGLPLELKYLPVIESALRPSATSRAGAAGLWQFMIATGKRYNLEVNTLVDERRDPIKSSDAAARYLRDLYGMFGDWGLAIAAYNCGEGNVQKALIRNGNQEGADFWTVYNRLPHETRGYVPAFIAANYIMTYYCEHGIVPHEATLPAESDTVLVANEIKLDRIASKCGVPLDELRSLNPQYRKDIIPAGYTLRLPSSAVESYITLEDSIMNGGSNVDISSSTIRRAVTEDLGEQQPSTSSSRSSRGSKATRNKRNNQSSKTVAVKSGDSLSTIASRNGTTVANIRRLNGIKGDMIKPGQKLRVK